MKKRLISIALMLVVLVSCLGLTACQVPQPEGNEVDSINGMDPVAAYEAAVDALDLTRFRVESSMGISLSLWVFPILDYSIPMMVCDTDGENVHQWITEEYFAVTEALGIEEEIFDELEQEGLELYEEMIYYNGVFYCRNGEELSKFQNGGYYEYYIVDAEIDQDVKNAVYSEDADIQCYEQDGQYYFTITIDMFDETSGEDEESSEDLVFQEIYYVWFDEQGRLDKTEIKYYIGTLAFEMTMDYSYDDIPAVTPPANAEDYA